MATKAITILAPGLLHGISGWQHYPELWPTVPVLQNFLSKANQTPSVEKDTMAFLCAKSAVESLAPAPLSLLADGGDPGAAHWMRAEPAFFQLDRDCIWVQPVMEAFSEQDAQTIFDLCQPIFESYGLSIEVPTLNRWYIKLDKVTDVETVSLVAASGCSADEVMPTGKDAAIWRQLMNEIQMQLYHHPVSSGINTAWVWGQGQMPGPVNLPYDCIVTDDAVTRGLALHSGCQTLPLSTDLSTIDFKRVLVVLQPYSQHLMMEEWCDALQQFEQQWLIPLMAQLNDKKIDQLQLFPFTEQAYQLTRFSLKRFWRRKSPLTHFTKVK